MRAVDPIREITFVIILLAMEFVFILIRAGNISFICCGTSNIQHTT